jgi:hypothetical protein
VFEALGPPLSFKVALLFEAVGPLSFEVALMFEASPVSPVGAAVGQPRDGTTAEQGDGTPDHHIGQAHSSSSLLRGATLGTDCSALSPCLLPSTRTPGLQTGAKGGQWWSLKTASEQAVCPEHRVADMRS